MALATDLLKNIKQAAAKSNTPPYVSAGEIPDKAFNDLQRLSDLYESPNAFITRHGLTSRINDGWEPEVIADAWQQLLDSDHTRGIPNPLNLERRGTEALWLPQGSKSLYAPVKPGKYGETQALTIFDPPTRQIRNDLQEYARSASSGLNREQIALIREVLKSSKGALGAVATGGLLALLGADEAQAAAPNQPASNQPDTGWPYHNNLGPEGEPGLQEPFFGPTDLILATAGIPGLAAKGAAAGTEAAIAAALDRLGNRLGQSNLLEIIGMLPQYIGN